MIDVEYNKRDIMKIENEWNRNNLPKSITPSGFFGNSKNNIVELQEFISKDEQEKLLNFAKNNKIWDETVSHYDDDGLVLYDHNVWKDRVCTYNSLIKSDPLILDLIYSLMRLLFNRKTILYLRYTL